MPKLVWQFSNNNAMSSIPYSVFEKDFKWQRHIGKGSCAKVAQYYHSISRKSYAVKRIELHSYDELMQAMNQIEVIRCLDDQRTTKIYYFYCLPGKLAGNFQLGIVMQLCKESLAEMIKARKTRKSYFKKQDLRTLLSTLVPFFAKMQTKGIFHRDIKPDNILLAQTKNIDYRVADFGFAIRDNVYTYRNVAGTIQYVSPKLLVKFKDHNASVQAHNIKDDVYSFGKMIGEYMTLDIDWLQIQPRLKQCNERYGKDYTHIINMATKQRESDRIDFIELYHYLKNRKLIESQQSQLSRTSFSFDRTRLSTNSTTNTSINSLQKTKVNQRRNSSLDKSKITQKKEIESYEFSTPNLCKRQQISSLENSLTQWRKKVVPMKDQVNCLQIYENLLFFGMQDKLGIMITDSLKMLRISHLNYLKQIHCLKVFRQNQMLVVSTLQGRVFCIPIHEIKKMITIYYQTLNTRNNIQVSLQDLKFKEYMVGIPVSSLDIITSIHKPTDFIIVLGHYTGEITVINNNKIQKKISFCNQPVTHLQVREGVLYTSNSSGLFKRQSAISLGLAAQTKKGQLRGDIFYNMFSNNQTYNCKEIIISFKIISNCKKNASIKKQENKYLAILVCWNGLINIITKAMRCEFVLRISENNVIGCFFKKDCDKQEGFSALAIDHEGCIIDFHGNPLAKTQEKGLTSVVWDGKNIFCGGFSKKVVCLTNYISQRQLQ